VNGCGREVALFVVVGKAEVRDRGGRNYSGDFMREDIGLCGSYESAVSGDTGNNCYPSGSGVGDAISSSELAPFA
jgi:hypothetical protein